MNSRLIFLFGLLLAGCSLVGSDDATSLRIENASDLDFSSVFVSFPNTEAEYGSIAAGQQSRYKRVDGVYRYGYLRVKAEGETYALQPVDFVGEKPLDAGQYTYQLDIVDGSLTLNLK